MPAAVPLTSPTVASVSSSPVASGLSEPSSRRAGPCPRKTSRLVPANVPVTESNVTSPSMVTKSPIFSDAPDTETTKTLPSAAPKLISTSRPSTSTVAEMAVPVVLMRTSTSPVTVTGPTDPVNVPANTPAMPPGATTNTPVPAENEPLGPSVTATEKLTSVKPMVVTTEPSDLVWRSIVSLPVALTVRPPASKSNDAAAPAVAPVISTRRYGPAGTSRSIVTPPPKSNSSSISVGDVFSVTATVTAPSRSIPSGMTGVTVPVAEMVPATPVGRMTNAAVPLVILTIPATSRPTSVAPTLMSCSPAAVVSCSNVKTPVSVWPAMVKVIGLPATPRRTRT